MVDDWNDVSSDEARRVLRRLELEAYSSITSALRAQGDLCKEKKQLLQDICCQLGISTERYRAELRRAANDDMLTAIANRLSGPSSSEQWFSEGRRLAPVVPRLVPQTPFTSIIASAAASIPFKVASGKTTPKEAVSFIDNKQEQGINGKHDSVEIVASLDKSINENRSNVTTDRKNIGSVVDSAPRGKRKRHPTSDDSSNRGRTKVSKSPSLQALTTKLSKQNADVSPSSEIIAQIINPVVTRPIAMAGGKTTSSSINTISTAQSTLSIEAVEKNRMTLSKKQKSNPTVKVSSLENGDYSTTTAIATTATAPPSSSSIQVTKSTSKRISKQGKNSTNVKMSRTSVSNTSTALTTTSNSIKSMISSTVGPTANKVKAKSAKQRSKVPKSISPVVPAMIKPDKVRTTSTVTSGNTTNSITVSTTSLTGYIAPSTSSLPMTTTTDSKLKLANISSLLRTTGKQNRVVTTTVSTSTIPFCSQSVPSEQNSVNSVVATMGSQNTIHSALGSASRFIVPKAIRNLQDQSKKLTESLNKTILSTSLQRNASKTTTRLLSEINKSKVSTHSESSTRGILDRQSSRNETNNQSNDGHNTLATLAVQSGEQDNSSQQLSLKPSPQILPNKLEVELPKSTHAHSSIYNESRKDADSNPLTDTDNEEVKIATDQVLQENSMGNLTPTPAIAEKTSNNNSTDNERMVSVTTTNNSIESLEDGVASPQAEKLSVIERGTTLGTSLVMDDHDYCIDSSTLSIKTAENINNSEVFTQISSGTDSVESLEKQVERNVEVPCALITGNRKSTITAVMDVTDKVTAVATIGNDVNEDQSHELVSPVESDVTGADDNKTDIVPLKDSHDTSVECREMSVISNGNSRPTSGYSTTEETTSKVMETDDTDNRDCGSTTAINKQIDMTNNFEIVVEKIEADYDNTNISSDIITPSLQRIRIDTDAFDAVSEDSLPDYSPEITETPILNTEISTKVGSNENSSDEKTHILTGLTKSLEVHQTVIIDIANEGDTVNSSIHTDDINLEIENSSELRVDLNANNNAVVDRRNDDDRWNETANNSVSCDKLVDTTFTSTISEGMAVDPVTTKSGKEELLDQPDIAIDVEMVTKIPTTVDNKGNDVSDVIELEDVSDFSKSPENEVSANENRQCDVEVDMNDMHNIKDTSNTMIGTVKDGKLCKWTNSTDLLSNQKENVEAEVIDNCIEADLSNETNLGENIDDSVSIINSETSKKLDEKIVLMNKLDIVAKSSDFDCPVWCIDNEDVESVDKVKEDGNLVAVRSGSENDYATATVISNMSMDNLNEVHIEDTTVKTIATDADDKTIFHNASSVNDSESGSLAHNPEDDASQIENSGIETNSRDLSDAMQTADSGCSNEVANINKINTNSSDEKVRDENANVDANSTCSSGIASTADPRLNIEKSAIARFAGDAEMCNSTKENDHVDSNLTIITAVIGDSKTLLKDNMASEVVDIIHGAKSISDPVTNDNVSSNVINVETTFTDNYGQTQASDELNVEYERGIVNPSLENEKSNKIVSNSQSTNAADVPYNIFTDKAELIRDCIETIDADSVDMAIKDVSNNTPTLKESEETQYTAKSIETKLEDVTETYDQTVSTAVLYPDDDLQKVCENSTDNTGSDNVLIDNQSRVINTTRSIDSNHEIISYRSLQCINNQIAESVQDVSSSKKELNPVQETKKNILIGNVSKIPKNLLINFNEDDKQSIIKNRLLESNSNDIGSDFDNLDKMDIVKDSSNGHMDIGLTDKTISKSNYGDDFRIVLKRKKHSKRKRKYEVSNKRNLNSLGVQKKWIKAAFNILHRICRFKGSDRPKKGYTAASWFLKPVEENHAPGYYNIVTNPMDFSTIRKKLENGAYGNYTDFNRDMELIRSNCYLYNPPDHAIRKDCDEVFEFYQGEYNKLLASCKNENESEDCRDSKILKTISDKANSHEI